VTRAIRAGAALVSFADPSGRGGWPVTAAQVMNAAIATNWHAAPHTKAWNTS